MGDAFGGDAHALVLDGDPGVAVQHHHPQIDAAVRSTVFHAVVHQNPHHLLDESLVGVHRHRFLPPPGQEEAVIVDHLLLPQHLTGQDGEVEVGALHRLGVVVPPGQEQQLLHQVLHGLGLGADGVDGLLEGLRVVLAPPVQEGGVALNDGDGGAQLVAGVGDEAHLSAVRLVDPVQHGVYGLGQRAQFLLGGGQVDAAVQMGGVDFFQFPRQGLQLLPGHVGHGVEPGGGGGQILNGLQNLVDGPVVSEQPGNQGEPFAGQQDHAGPVERAGDAGQIHRDGVGLPVVGQHNGVVGGQVPGAHAVFQLRILGEEGEREERVPHRLAVRAIGRGFHSHAPRAVDPQRGNGVVAGLHPGDGIGGGDAPLLHQGSHRGAPVFRVEKQPGGGHEKQQQIHYQENDQLPEEKAEVQAKDQR